MNWYSKREPVLFLVLLLMTIILFFISGLFSEWSLIKTLTDADLEWRFFILAAILPLFTFIGCHFLFPSAILSISTSDGTTLKESHKESQITVLFDGRTITLKADLPQQVRLFFWKKGEYKVYVTYTVNDGDPTCESGIINLYEDRHIEIEIPLTK